jgi:hypothetical protein
VNFIKVGNQIINLDHVRSARDNRTSQYSPGIDVDVSNEDSIIVYAGPEADALWDSLEEHSTDVVAQAEDKKTELYILADLTLPLQGDEELVKLSAKRARERNDWLKCEYDSRRYILADELLGAPEEAPEEEPEPVDVNARHHFDLTEQEAALIAWSLHYLLGSDAVTGEHRGTLEELSFLFDSATEGVPFEAPSPRWCVFDDCDQEPLPGDELCQGHREQDEAEVAYQTGIALHDRGECGGNCQLDPEQQGHDAEEPAHRQTVAEVRAQHRQRAVVDLSDGTLEQVPTK